MRGSGEEVVSEEVAGEKRIWAMTGSSQGQFMTMQTGVWSEWVGRGKG